MKGLVLLCLVGCVVAAPSESGLYDEQVWSGFLFPLEGQKSTKSETTENGNFPSAEAPDEPVKGVVIPLDYGNLLFPPKPDEEATRETGIQKRSAESKLNKKTETHRLRKRADWHPLEGDAAFPTSKTKTNKNQNGL